MVDKNIYLLRHAHALPESLGLPDFARPLEPRGHEEAAKVCDYLLNQEAKIDYVLCSNARRTVETFDGLNAFVKTQKITDVVFSEELYGASCGDLFSMIQSFVNGVNNVLIVGHNPAIEQLAYILSKGEGSLFEKGVKPATLLHFKTKNTWSDLDIMSVDFCDVFYSN